MKKTNPLKEFLKPTKLKLIITLLLGILLFIIRTIFVRLNPRLCLADLPASGCPFYYGNYLPYFFMSLILLYLLTCIIEYIINGLRKK